MRKLITQTIIKNEEKRFLSKWLDMLATIADVAVIYDDCSDDKTADIIDTFIKEKKLPWKLVRGSESLFSTNESKLRRLLWDEVRTVSRHGDWVLTIDSDEFDTGDIKQYKQKLLNTPESVLSISFKKIETWDEENNYRIDGLWSNYFTRMFRFIDVDFGYKDREGLHCPSIPVYALSAKNSMCSDLSIFHRGYETKEMRQSKYEFMKNNADPNDAINYNHVLSCIEPPELKKFEQGIYDELNLNVIVNNKYDISVFLEHMLNTNYNLKKLNVVFVVYNCSSRVIKLLEKIKTDMFKSVDLSIINFEVQDFYRNANNNKQKVMYKTAMDFFEKGKTFMIDITHFTNHNILKHILLTDKNFCYYGNNLETIFVNKIEDFSVKTVDMYPTSKIGLFEEGKKMYHFVWNCNITPWI